jgi:hypothetical protein
MDRACRDVEACKERQIAKRNVSVLDTSEEEPEEA